MSGKYDPFATVDHTLKEVREILTIARDAGDVNELVVLQMLLQVTKELHGIESLRDLVTKVLDSALAFTDGERAFVMMLEGDGSLRFKMGRTMEGDYLSVEDFSPSTTIVQQVIEVRDTLIIPDAQADEALSKRQSIVEMGLRTIMCAPLISKKEVLGVLYVDSRQTTPPTFSQRAYLNFLSSLADQAAVAIRNAQKFETQT
jgi:GAF domain-containing protein